MRFTGTMRLAALAVFTMFAAAASAQEPAAPAAAQQPPAGAQESATASGFDVHGSVDAGYRFRDLDGSEAAYRQIFDLEEGLRLFGADLYGTAKEKGRGFADTFSIRATGVGGDPFPTLQASMQKPQVYDFRFNWRKSRFVNAFPLTPAAIDGFDTQAVTDNHTLNTSRQIGNVALTLHPSSTLHLLFNYDRVSRSGLIRSTRSLDFLGAPTTWGAFARANPYPVVTPADETSDAATGGVSYTRRRWTVHYKAGYHTYRDTQVVDPVKTPETSVNVTDAATATEPLAALAWSQSRRLTGPSSDLSYVVQPTPKLDWRGQYLYFRHHGPLNVDAVFQGTARTTGTGRSPYDVAVTSRGDVVAPNHVVGQGVTFRPFAGWAFDVDYRYSRFASDTHGAFGSLLALYPPASATTPVAASEVEDVSWRQSLHTIAVAAIYEPTTSLTVRPGIRWTRRVVDARLDGVTEPELSNHERTWWPEIRVGYRPSASFSARGSLRNSYSDTSYTRLSPTRRNIGNAIVRYEPLTGLSIEGSVSRTDAELLSTGFISHTRLGAVHVTYTYNERVILTGGLDYQTFLGTGTVTFVRGTLPIENLQMRDSEADRVWQAGGTVKISERFGVTGMANYDVVTGFDTIQGEPPLYGPLTFPYVTGTIYYDFPRAGRVSLDLQRTHLYQDILSLNDFRATLVTIRFSRGF